MYPSQPISLILQALFFSFKLLLVFCIFPQVLGILLSETEFPVSLFQKPSAHSSGISTNYPKHLILGSFILYLLGFLGSPVRQLRLKATRWCRDSFKHLWVSPHVNLWRRSQTGCLQGAHSLAGRTNAKRGSMLIINYLLLFWLFRKTHQP